MVRECKKCGRRWYYPVHKCIFCNTDLVDIIPKEYTVRGITEVYVPSVSHRQVPYYDILLEDERGNLYIKKTFRSRLLGEKIRGEKKRKEKKGVVGVVGTGIGAEIAQLAAESGYTVILKSRTKSSIESAMQRIQKNLLRNLSEDEKDSVLSRIKGTEEYTELVSCDIVIESILEDFDKKSETFRRLEDICPDETIFASNTSSLSIDRLAQTTSRADRFIGMHFFNPPTKMKLVEIVRGKETSDKTVEYTMKLAEEMNKTAIMVSDTPCFIVNRMLMPYLNEAVILFEENAATPEDIDKAARLGLNHPLGPLALLDLIGVDVFVKIMNNLYDRSKNPKYLPAKTTVDMVARGELGRKTGKGFYIY
jgi:3-hydroxybutyryl-CoA dehydrogenase